MSIPRKPMWGLAALLTGFAALSPPPRASAAPNWADANYRNRRQITVSNYANGSLGLNDVIAFPFTPNGGIFDGKTLASGNDVHIFYQPTDTSVTDVAQQILYMGSGSGRVLFQAAAPLPAGAPYPYVKSNAASSTFNAAAGVSLNLRGDDQTKTVTLPFDFSWRGQTYRQLLVSTNGWVSFNLSVLDAHYLGFNFKNSEQSQDGIAPFATDLVTLGTDGGDVFEDDSVANQVTFRWKAAKFVQANVYDTSPLNFAVTLKSDNTIRFSYGNCAFMDNGEQTRQVDVGLALDTTDIDLLDQYPAARMPSNTNTNPPNTPTPPALDFSNHPDILFTPQTVSVTQDAGYYVYYNYPQDTGRGTRPLLDPAKVISYTFDDGTEQGWTANPGAPDTYDVTAQPDGLGGGVLRLRSGSEATGASGAHPAAIAESMPNVGDQTVYAKMRGTGNGRQEVGILLRANDSNGGYGLDVNGFNGYGDSTGLTRSAGTVTALIARTSPERSADTSTTFTYDPTTPDYENIGVFDYYQPGKAAWNYAIVKAQGSGDNISLAGKVIQENFGENAGFELWAYPHATTIPTNDVPIFNSGKLGLTGSGGGISNPPDNQELDWAYAVTNPYAELMDFTAAAEEELPVPAGKGVLKGTITDAASTALTGITIGVSGAKVVLTPSNGANPTVTVTTDINGGFNVYVAPDTYTVSVTASGYNAATSSNVVVSAGPTGTIANVALSASNLLGNTNPSFEIEDTVANGDANAPTGGGSVKPLGWYRLSLGSAAATYVLPDPNAITDPQWKYITTGSDTVAGKTVTAHTGTHFVGVEGTLFTGYPSNIGSWDTEGSQIPNYNVDGTGNLIQIQDSRGKGSLAPTVPGAYYQISCWVNKPFASGTARVRIRDIKVNNDGTYDSQGNFQLVSNGLSLSQSAVTSGWKQLSAVYQAASTYITVRLYGIDVATGSPVYFDDVSISRITPPIYRGTVKDSTGKGLAGVDVGVRESSVSSGTGLPSLAGGLANPVVNGFTRTDGLGRWAVQFLPVAGKTYVVQAWKDQFVDQVGNLASATIALGANTAQTNITYDPHLEGNIALGKSIAAVSSEAATDQQDAAPTSGPAIHATDGLSNWWSSDYTAANAPGGDPAAYPNDQYIVIDLGRTVDFSTVQQVTLEWREAPDFFEVHVGNAAPPPNKPNADQATDDAATDAAYNYGTVIYSSPYPAGTRGQRNSVYNISLITPPAGGGATGTGFTSGFNNANGATVTGVTGRYLLIYCGAYLAPYTAYKLYEARVEVPTSTVAGRVVGPDGRGLGNAVVGINPDGPLALYTRTDAAGNYTISGVPVAGPITLTASTISSGSTVYPLSNPATVTPVAGTTVGVPDLSIGAAVQNLVPQGATVTTDRGGDSGLETAATPPSAVADYSFSSIFQTSTICPVPAPGCPAVDAANPLDVIVDLGSAKSINQVVLTWTASFSPSYSVDLSTDGINFSSVYATSSASGGYPYTIGTGASAVSLDGVDVVAFSAVTARYLRVSLTSHIQSVLGIREIQAALTTVTNPLTRQDAINALRIAGGLATASSADFAKYNLATTGTSANKIDLIDASTILRRVNRIG